MTGVRVKICGLTREQDVLDAVQSGADAIGFVFAHGSKRQLMPDRAAELVRLVPAFVTTVGLFLDQEATEVAKILTRVPLGLLQFHGKEGGAYCRQFDRPYIKAVGMQHSTMGESFDDEFYDTSGLLLDSHVPGGLGGTGKVFDWTTIQRGRLPLILAGGLNCENVAEAVKQVRPWAVDVSSGVEQAPGIKDDQKVRKFIIEAKREY